jgi:hypothetical protein
VSQVVGIRGAIPPAEGTSPNPDVVAFIDRLMQEALTGSLQGIAVVKVDRIGSITTDWQARGVERFTILAGASLLQRRICKECDGGEEE